MDVAELVERYPRLYHMASAGSWPSIQRHGLLSTTALLDLFGKSGPERLALEEQHRPEAVIIRHPEHGLAVVRDQKPLHEGRLRGCLRDGLTPRDWYRLLNSRVFFWLTRTRLDDLLQARAYRGARHLVLTLRTDLVVEQYADKIRLSAINSGATVYGVAPRGLGTFLSISEYPYSERRRARGPAGAIAELTIEGALPDVSALVVRVDEVGDGPARALLTLADEPSPLASRAPRPA